MKDISVNLFSLHLLQNCCLKKFLCNFMSDYCCFSIWDKPFSTEVKSRSRQWWSVDLIALRKIHLVRIVTASGYKPEYLRGLRPSGLTYASAHTALIHRLVIKKFLFIVNVWQSCFSFSMPSKEDNRNISDVYYYLKSKRNTPPAAVKKKTYHG